MNANMFKWEIIWIVPFVNYVSIVLYEINDNSNENPGSILWETTFWIIASYSYDNLRNSWLCYFRNFIIVIERCVNDWIFLTFYKFPCIVWIYAWFFMHCRNHHSDNHVNHVINWYKILQITDNYFKSFDWTNTFKINISIITVSTKWKATVAKEIAINFGNIHIT